MSRFPLLRLATILGGGWLAGLVGPNFVLARPAGPPESADSFVQACTTQLALTEAQRTSLRAYLEQEIEYMAVQAANHPAADVAALVPAERAQLQAVAGRLLSPGQLRQFRELEATPKMQAYLKQMSLEN